MPPDPVSRRAFLRTGSCALFTASLLASSGAALSACDSVGGTSTQRFTTSSTGIAYTAPSLLIDIAAIPGLDAVGGSVWIGDIDVIVVHAAAGDYRAFDSVCPHEHNDIRVVEASGGSYRLRCPSHNWTFDLNGGPTGQANRGTTRYALTEMGGSLQITVA